MAAKKENIKVWKCGAENESDIIATLKDRVLTFVGKGKPVDLGNNGATWQDEDFHKVIIGDGITAISNNMFKNCIGLNSVEMADTVSSIGSCAFYNCHALWSIQLSNSLLSIGSRAFENCNALQSIELNEALSYIGDSAFKEAGLTSIEIPESVTTIGRLFLYGTPIKKIINKRKTPQNVNIGTLLRSNYVRGNSHGSEYHHELASLYVPASAINTYKSQPTWGKFFTILPIPVEEKNKKIEEDTLDGIEEKIHTKNTEIDIFKEKIKEIQGEIKTLEGEIEELIIKKMIMRGLDGNPKEVAEFMSLFNQRDGLKYLTHDFDESAVFNTESFLEQTKTVFLEKLEQYELPESLTELIRQFSLEKNPKWSAFDKEFNKKEITSGWSTLNQQDGSLHPIRDTQFAEIIKDFRRTTRIESPNLERLINKLFNDNGFEIATQDLSKADFYTHVGKFSSALETIFKEIKQRGDSKDKKNVSVAYKKAGAIDDFFIRDIIITHHNSFPTRDGEDLINEWLALEKGNMGKIALYLKGYCHWSVITKIGDKYVKVNILREKETPAWEEVDASEVNGFTHILKFYYHL